MAYENLKKLFPEEGNLCKKMCGKCCSNSAPVELEEAKEIAYWLVRNVEVDEIKAQFAHFDTQPDRCPFLKPDKGCFVYPARPMVCRMFGHLPDAPGLDQATRNKISQQCPEGVAFTQVSMDKVLEEVGPFMQKANQSSIRTLQFRFMEMVGEGGRAVEIPPVPGSAFEKLTKATCCTRCGIPFPNRQAYLEGAELLCKTCDDNYVGPK